MEINMPINDAKKYCMCKAIDSKPTKHIYRRQYELISNLNVGLKTLLREGLSEPEFYCDLVYK